MFKIYDGRNEFYQWDLDRKLIVEDATVNQVHFCNCSSDYSLVCEVRDEGNLRVVDVPNILLQSDWKVHAYAYDINYTKHEKLFKINARTKPEDYVYTETEVLNYNTLLERINEVNENIGQAVEDYLAENPIEVDLSGYATKEDLETIELTPGPKGDPGEPGQPGKDGEDGYTPVKGVDYFDGEPGQPGEDGYTPVKGVDYFDGAPGQPGKDGNDGQPGADGYTPVKGTDYWTEEDKTEIVEDVLASIEIPEADIVPYGFSSGAFLKALVMNDLGNSDRVSAETTNDEILKLLEQGHVVTWGSTDKGSITLAEPATVTYFSGGKPYRGTNRTVIELTVNQNVIKIGYNNYIYGKTNEIKGYFQGLFYDNSKSGLTATTLPGAIDELKTLVDNAGSVDLSNYYTKTEVDNAITSAIGEVENGAY